MRSQLPLEPGRLPGTGWKPGQQGPFFWVPVTFLAEAEDFAAVDLDWADLERADLDWGCDERWLRVVDFAEVAITDKRTAAMD
jgi:hypothetical protein